MNDLKVWPLRSKRCIFPAMYLGRRCVKMRTMPTRVTTITDQLRNPSPAKDTRGDVSAALAGNPEMLPTACVPAPKAPEAILQFGHISLRTDSRRRQVMKSGSRLTSGNKVCKELGMIRNRYMPRGLTRSRTTDGHLHYLGESRSHRQA